MEEFLFLHCIPAIHRKLCHSHSQMYLSILLASILGSLFTLFVQPIHGFCIYCSVLLLQPQVMLLPLGSVDFNSSRVVVLSLLLATIIKRPDLCRNLRWNLADSSLLLFFFGQVLALMQTEPLMTVVENRAGRFFDTILPYILTRLIIVTRRDLTIFLRCLLTIAVVLAFFGILESLTGRNVIGFSFADPSIMRHGFYRARGTFSVSIAFGLLFSQMFAVALSLWLHKDFRRFYLALSAIISMFGALSSMSSGPIFALYVTVLFLAMYPIRKTWPLILTSIIAMLVMVDCLSNRRWYHVLTRLALSGSKSYYRIQLYQETFGGGMTGRWLFGWGLVDMYSSYDRFPWVHTDLTSWYIATIVRYGLVGALPLLLFIVAYSREMCRGFAAAISPADRWMVWCIAGGQIGWNVAMFTVNSVSQTLTLIFVFPALICNLASIMRAGSPSRSSTERC